MGLARASPDLTVLDAGQVWVNPDCGLKTRKPEETTAALQNMVAAAKEVRAGLNGQGD